MYPVESSPMFNAVHDLHNNALKFKILKDGVVDWPIQRGFKGGGIRQTVVEGCKVKKTKNWLIIYHNRRERIPLRDLERTADTILTGMTNLALQISHRYNLTIDPTPLPFSSNRPEVKTPYTSAVNFIEPEAKAVYPIPSPIELTGPNAVKNSMNLTEMIAQLDQSVQAFHAEINTHLEATKRWEAAADRIALVKVSSEAQKSSVWSRIIHFLWG